MNTTITLRQKALEAALAEGPQMLRYEHEMNYWTLYVHRDGSVSWGNEVNSDSLLIDRDAPDFRPVQYLVQVGTGSCGCNCDWCVDGEEYNPQDDEADVYDYAEKQITEAFDDVPSGYFDDEDEEDEEEESLEELGPEYDVDVTVCEMPDVNGVVRTVYTCSGFLGNIQALERATKGRYERFGGDQRMFVEVDE